MRALVLLFAAVALLPFVVRRLSSVFVATK